MDRGRRGSVSAQLAQRIRELRKQRGWSVQRLADECAAVGMESLTRSTLAKIETGIRDSVTVDELAVIAKALGELAADLMAAGAAAAGYAQDAGDTQGLVKAISERGAKDLSQILPNLGSGESAATREELANQPETRMYLKAGLALLRDDLLGPVGLDADQVLRSPLFESLSRERIMQRAADSGDEHARYLTVAMFRTRWPRKDDYTEDLIAFIFRAGPTERRLDELNATITRPLMTLELDKLVRHIAAAVIQGMTDDPLSSLQAMIEAALPSHPVIRRHVELQVGTILPRWAELYQRIGVAKGYRLKRGYTWPDMALLFNLVTLGVLVRTRLQGFEPKLSTGERVLDKAILAMLPSLIEPSPAGTTDPEMRPAARPADRLLRRHEQEDLAPVLTRIGSGKRALTRRRLANDPDTRKFLEFGVSLLLDDWIRYTGPGFKRGFHSRLFQSLSRERVLQRAIDLNPGHSKSLTPTSFRNRWAQQDHYTEDLVSYLFRPAPIHAYVDEMSGTAEDLIIGDRPALPDLIRRLTVAASSVQATGPLFGLTALIQAALPSHPGVREAWRAQHDLTLPCWAALYKRIGTAYGLELLPDVTWLDMAELFELVTGGVLPRTRIYAGEPTLSSEEGSFAGAIIAMLPALARERLGTPEALAEVLPIAGR